MRKILGALLIGALFVSSLASPARAADRVVVYPMENPSSTQTNQQLRNVRRSNGNFWLNAFGQSIAEGGVYADCNVVPSSGYNVVVEPANSSQLCSLYQLQQVDANPVPSALPSGVTGSTLSPDSTLVMVDALQQSVSSAIGPLTPPGSNSKYYLIEAQIQTVDTNPTSSLFVDSSGNPFTETVNATRSDQIVYQLVAGTASSSPVEPTPDAGWLPIAYVLVPSTASTITSGMITMAPAFNGFLTSGSGNSYTGNQTIAPACTGSSSANCPSSGGWAVQSSVWNGSSAVTDTWELFADSSGYANLRLNNAREFAIDASGNAILYGSLEANSAPLDLCGNTTCSNPVAIDPSGDVSAPGNVTATGNVVGANGTFSSILSGNTLNIASGDLTVDNTGYLTMKNGQITGGQQFLFGPNFPSGISAGTSFGALYETDNSKGPFSGTGGQIQAVSGSVIAAFPNATAQPLCATNVTTNTCTAFVRITIPDANSVSGETTSSSGAPGPFSVYYTANVAPSATYSPAPVMWIDWTGGANVNAINQTGSRCSGASPQTGQFACRVQLNGASPSTAEFDFATPYQHQPICHASAESNSNAITSVVSTTAHCIVTSGNGNTDYVDIIVAGNPN